MNNLKSHQNKNMWIDQKFIILKEILNSENGSLLDLGSRDQILKSL